MFKRLFCKHKWNKISFEQIYDKDVRYSLRTYKCSKCGRETKVDGRYDNISE